MLPPVEYHSRFRPKRAGCVEHKLGADAGVRPSGSMWLCCKVWPTDDIGHPGGSNPRLRSSGSSGTRPVFTRYELCERVRATHVPEKIEAGITESIMITTLSRVAAWFRKDCVEEHVIANRQLSEYRP